MDRFIDYMAIKRGMAEALRAVVTAGRDPYNQSRARVTEALSLLLEAGQRAGVLRADVTADDVLSMCVAFLSTVDNPKQARRLAAILVDGLRYRASDGPKAQRTSRAKKSTRKKA